jgi:DNA-binding MarR family transcriptional regulator
MIRNLMDTDFGIVLALAYGAFVDELHEALAAAGFADLGRVDGYVFRALADEPLSLSTLAARLAVSNQAAVKVVDAMEARGYVTRVADAHDRRVKRLRLTARGEAALAAARAFHAAYEQRLAGELGPERAAALRAGLEQLAGRREAATGRAAGLRPL